MTSLMVPPEEGRKTRRFSVEEFYQMSEAGILGADHRRLELLDGLILEPMPTGPKHAGLVNMINCHFGQRANGNYITAPQNPVRISAFSEPLPDIALLKPRDDFYRSAHPQPQDVMLLVEVADSSLAFDLGKKARAYAIAGIGEYWVVDVAAEAVHVFRKPSAGDFRESEILHRGQSIAPIGLEDCAISLAVLFGEPASI